MTTLEDLRRAARTNADAVTWLSLYVALLFLVPSKLVLGPLGSAGAPSMVMGLASLLLWLTFRAGMPSAPRGDPHPIGVALGLFVFSVGTSYAVAMARPMNTDEISPADVALLAVASWSGTLLVAHDGIPSRERLDTLVWRLAVCGGIVALLGLLQVLSGRPWIDRVHVPGLTETAVAGLYTRGAFFRPSGTAAHPIEYGVLITMLLPLALHVGFHHRQRPLALRWAPAVALAAVIPLTSSRSAYVGALIGMSICMVGWSPARRRRMIVVGIAGVVAMAAVTPHLFNSIVNLFAGASEDPSIASRTGSYELAGQFIERHPLFGRGLGTFLPKYRIFDNQYLGLLVTVGVVGTVLFLALGLTAIVTMIRLRRRTPREDTGDLAMALGAAVVVGFVSVSMFDAFAFPMTVGALFLCLGLAGALRRLERARAVPHVGDGVP